MYKQYLTKWAHVEYMQGHSSINKPVNKSGDLKLTEMCTELVADACLM